MTTTAVTERRPARRLGPSRALNASLVILLAVLVAAAILVSWRIHACLPQLDGTVEVSGLEAPVEVLRDAHGVPHLRAQSLDDVFFAQGYVTAQDRLWQMDLSRRLARGELAEILGSRGLQSDIENRTLGFPEAAERAARELDPAGRRVLAAYTRGVNAFIETHRHRLPLEFLLLHYQPRPWQDSDVFSIALNMAKVLNTSWRVDLMRERILNRLGPQLYADLFPDRSPLDRPVAEAVAAPPRQAAPSAARGAGSSGDLREPAKGSAPPADPALVALTSPEADFDPALGSNNWVVSGAHTASGKPLLSNDPHLGHSLPSVWYMIHLEAPGLDVSGVSLPGSPGVVIGHNRQIAWGMTNTGPDVQDLFVETFNPRHPNQYLHNGQWVEAEVRQETIKVRGQPDQHLTVRVTRHGPVISSLVPAEAARGRQLALEWTALLPHALTFPVVQIDQAQNWQEFTAALRSFMGPEQNIVYADVEGNIGYYAPAWVPLRKHGDGSLPVPGDTDDDDWVGAIPFEDLPHAYNPPGGIIATANSRVVPDGYPYFLTHDWAPPWRTARIFQLLEAGSRFTVPDMLRIDMDIHSLEDEWLAKRLLEAAQAFPPRSPDARYALSLLRQWDGEARMDSAATLVCEATRPALLERILKPKLGDDWRLYHWGLELTFVDNAIEKHWTRWLPPGDADFNVTLIQSLEDGVQRIRRMVGRDDRRAWRWGPTIPLTFHHALDHYPLVGRFFDLGPFPQAGTATTVKATTMTSGPSMRMVVDLGNLDDSVNHITLGESGQLGSPYYQDQFPAWYTGRGLPMLFSGAAVGAGAAHRLVLKPEP